jgi:hypothetical protein
MPRNMSFMLTTKQIKNKTKTVTRRCGWWFLKPGDILNAAEKCQGIKKGEKINKICQIKVVHTEPVFLFSIKNMPEDCRKEGFPDLTPQQFIDFFCKEMKCTPQRVVNRIAFEYI